MARALRGLVANFAHNDNEVRPRPATTVPGSNTKTTGTISTSGPVQQSKPEKLQLAHQTPYPNFVVAGIHTRNDIQCSNVILFVCRFYPFMFQS